MAADRIATPLARATAAGLLLVALASTASSQPAPLTSPARIRELAFTEVASALPVAIEGVVVGVSADRRRFVLHDGSTGVFVRTPAGRTPPAVGDRARVTGTTVSEGLAPAVEADAVTVVGRGDLPAPVTASVSDLASGTIDAQWIEIEGIVRTVSFEGGDAVAQFATGSHVELTLRVAGAEAARAGVLPDARLRVRGACEVKVDEQHRPIAVVELLSPGRAFVTVLDEGAADPFSLPLRSVRALWEFNAQRWFGRLVRLRGTVTLQRSGLSIYVRDATGSIYADTLDSTPLTVGDTVDVVGFLANVDGPVLENSTYRFVSHGDAPRSRAVTPEDIANGRVLDELVTLPARLGHASGDSLWVTAGTSSFYAVLEGGDMERLEIPSGSDLELTGIGITVLRDGRMVGFRLRLRSNDDVTVVRRAWAWSAERIAAAVAVVLVVGLLLVAWNLALKRKVRAQTDALLRSRDAAEASTRAKGEFLANMSHEIRTPMNGILGMTELAMDTPLTDTQREYLGAVQASARSLLVIIDDILDLSRIEAGRMPIEPVPTEVRVLVRDALRPLAVRAAEKGLAFAEDVAADVPTWVMIDPVRFRQVLVNLVGNAVKFTDVGSVRVQATRAGARDAAGRVPLAVSVTDTGSGIPHDKLGAIFEAFTQADGSVTRRHGGTGLGLSISAKLTALLGGRLEVDSTLGAGSRFTVVVPVEEVEPEAAPGLRALAAPSPPRRVLIVDDSPVNLRVACGVLRRRGHDVTTAEDAHAALEILARERFDVVLMDVQMPGMNGLEATAEIRRREGGSPRRTPIVAVTAHAMVGDRERCLEAGVDGYVAKPIDPATLVAEIERVIALTAA
jgi:signal transduction histidine kinase/ActR/RegA family two-component response regulator